jgi:energy-converting hydrogenase Eha subunit E
VKDRQLTLSDIQMASALIAGVGILTIADYVSSNLSSPALNYLYVEMAMIGVATALVAYMHVHGSVRFGTPILVLLAGAWGIAAALFGPALMSMIPLALIALLSCTAGMLRQFREKVPA